MNQKRPTWIFPCLCITIPLSLLIFLAIPILGLLTLFIGLLAIGILYTHQTQDSQRSREPKPQTTSDSEAHIPRSIQLASKDSPSTTINEKGIAPPEQNSTPPLITSKAPISDRTVRTKTLQKRIAQLEKQVETLQKQLVEDPSLDTKPFSESISPLKVDKEKREEEFSVFAIHQLLETLDEKLAKRAISRQLYNQLRDKYLARLEKAKHRRKTSQARGKNNEHR
ncbi:MAG: hypothetical protein ACFFD8_01390 [Candidatus Thorarchaeota archaeon]